MSSSRAPRVLIALAMLPASAACTAGAVAVTAGTAQAVGYQVTAVWGEHGTAPGQLVSPKSAAVDISGFVYVVDYADHTVIKYTAEGEVARVWGGHGDRPGQFINPSRIALAPDGSLYVTDAGNYRVQRFSSEGRLLSVWGSRGRGPGQFVHPRGICVAADGRVYVTDEGNARLQVFTRSGRFLRAWGSFGSRRGQFSHPKDVAVSPGGRVYVVEAGNHRLQVFTAAGRWLATWGGRGSAPGRFAGPRGVVVGPGGHVFVADAENSRLQEFRSGGSLVRVWGLRGTLPGLVAGPRDLAFAPDGTVVVADTTNHRLQRFALSSLDDGEAPVTTCDVTSGWWRHPVTATLQAGDAGSGVAVTYVRRRAQAPFAAYAGPVALQSEGVWRLQYASVDAAGNQEQVRQRTLRLDWTAPAVASLSCRGGLSGDPVRLRFVLADALSPTCRVCVQVVRRGVTVRSFAVGWLAASPRGREHVVRFGSWLAPGSYEVRVIARDRAGNRRTRAVSLALR